MKVRIRCRQQTKVLEVDDTCTITDFYRLVNELYAGDIPNEYFLSLNRKDALITCEESSSDDLTLKDCNIVSGDLIHVVSSEEPKNGADCLTKDRAEGVTKDSKNVDIRDVGHQCNTVKSSTSSYHETPSSTPNVEAMDEDPSCDQAAVNQCLSEPLLCRECSQGRIPSQLAKVYGDSSITNEYEALIVALHILMLESGYHPTQLPSCSDSDKEESMNTDWKTKAPGSYSLTYRHQSCNDKEVFTLLCVSLSGTLIIHGISPDKEDRQCLLKLKCSEYVSYTHQDVHGIYRNLPKLSMLFKDSISLPLLETFRQNHGYPVLSGFMALSHEIKLTILSFLDISSVINIMCVCKDLHQISRDKYVWRRLYLKQFGSRLNNDLSQDWYSIYKVEYQIRKQRENERKRHQRLMTTVIPPVFRPPPDPGFPNPLPPYPPGIIGGDFDLLPQFHGPNLRRGGSNPLAPLQPRFDPIGPDLTFRPGRGGGFRDNRGWFGRGGPRFF